MATGRIYAREKKEIYDVIVESVLCHNTPPRRDVRGSGGVARQRERGRRDIERERERNSMFTGSFTLYLEGGREKEEKETEETAV